MKQSVACYEILQSAPVSIDCFSEHMDARWAIVENSFSEQVDYLTIRGERVTDEELLLHLFV